MPWLHLMFEAFDEYRQQKEHAARERAEQARAAEQDARASAELVDEEDGKQKGKKKKKKKHRGKDD